jgi:hypothetical protein
LVAHAGIAGNILSVQSSNDMRESGERGFLFGSDSMRIAFVAAFVLALCALACADVIHFVDGSRLEGKIVKETADMIVLDTGREQIPIQKSVIKRIERDAPEPQEQPKDEPEAEPGDEDSGDSEEQSGEEQELTEEQKKEAEAIKKAHKKWMSDRKKIRCTTCKGLGKVICPACKGSGRYQVREPYSGKLIRDEKCKTCDGNRLVICPKCENGLNPKYAKRVFWEILPPSRRKKLEEKFESEEKFLKWLYKAFHGELGEHASIAGRIEFIDHNKYISFEIVSYEFNEDLTKATVSVRLKENLSQKPEERTVERLRWVKEEGEWYLDTIGD